MAIIELVQDNLLKQLHNKVNQKLVCCVISLEDYPAGKDHQYVSSSLVLSSSQMLLLGKINVYSFCWGRRYLFFTHPTDLLEMMIYGETQLTC